MVSNKTNIWQKVWHFIWKEDSLLSWIVNIVLAFIIVKFLIYPGLGLLFGTSHPVVAVVSGSMEHDGSFEDWWKVRGSWYEDVGYTSEQVKAWDFSNGFNKGDIMVLVGTKADKLKVGNVIVFRGNSKEPIIHRVVLIHRENGKIYMQTKGDHNFDSLVPLGEDRIAESDIIGKAVFRIPYLGWIKIFAVDTINMFKGGAVK